MDVLSKMVSIAPRRADEDRALLILLFVIIFQFTKGNEAPVTDTCKVTPDIMDSSSDSGGSGCKILKSLPPYVTIYENRSAELCVFTTSECDVGLVHWNDIPYFHGRVANRTLVADGIVEFRYVLEPSETSTTENGSLVKFEVSTGMSGFVVTNASVILIAGPPIRPQNISVTFNCSTAEVTWRESPGARSYNVTVDCDGTFVAQNAIVYDNAFKFSYGIGQRWCTVSVYAVNPAGSSAMNSINDRILQKESNYGLYYDIGVKFNKDGKAHVFFNISIMNECSYSGPHNVLLCVDRNCFNYTIGFVNASWLYKVLEEFQLPLHERFRVTVTVCDDHNCTTFSKQITTFHIANAGGCKDNGQCVMRCEAVQDYPVKGCVYTITDRNTGVLIHTDFIEIGQVMHYNIKYDGQFTISIFDWEDGIKWNTIPPVFTNIIQVSRERINDSVAIVIAGSVCGALALLLISIIVVIILVFVLVYKRRTDQEVLDGDAERQRTGLDTDDAVIRMDNLDDKKPNDDSTKSDSKESDTPLTKTGDHPQTAPSSVTDMNGAGVVLETAMPRAMTESTSACNDHSDEPLLSNRSPPHPSAKRLMGGEGGRPCTEMTSHKLQFSRFANTVQEEAGFSMKSGEPMVTVNSDEGTAGILCGSKVIPAAKDAKDFSLPSPSQAQSGMNDGQAAKMVSGVFS